MEEEKKWRCRRCGAELVKQKAVFDYLGHNFGEYLDCCPNCGRVLLTKELVETKVTEVESLFEEK